MPIKIIIYEDNNALRESLQVLLNGLDKFHVVGSFGDCLAVENQVRTLKPDIVLMDIDMPGRNGIVGVGLVKKTDPSVETLMLTVFDDNDKVFQALCAGASGYLLKKTPPHKILEAIEELYEGGAPMTPSIARKVLTLFPRTPTINHELEKLTPREQEVLHSLAEGNSYKMIADVLSISVETVRTHIKRIYEKLHVHSVSEAIAKVFLKKL
jgi:DNA-binding NarL/FixJ family response regulator